MTTGASAVPLAGSSSSPPLGQTSRTGCSPNDQASIEEEVKSLVQILPNSLSAQLLKHPELHNLSEVVLDIGRKPKAIFGKHHDHIRDSAVVAKDLKHVVSQVDQFGGDNRAGIEGTLHRISCIRDRGGTVIGLTLAVGKPVIGPAAMLDDILQERKSVLILGPPGVGKTTVIRDVARVMSTKMGRRVMIVDTSNEIGGHGNIPHPFIGESRRIQVPNIQEQYNVMVEAVQNHRPEVIVVDEVGRKEEVDACRSIGERGVQMIATVHGHTLESLVKNPQLVGLVGGICSVIVGDITAMRRAGDFDEMRKTVREREGPSAFQVLVEMRSRETWYIHDVETSVDKIMKGEEVTAKVRSLAPFPGAVPSRLVPSSPLDGTVIPDERPSSKGEVKALLSNPSPPTQPSIPYSKNEKDHKEAFHTILEDFVASQMAVMGLSIKKAQARSVHKRVMTCTTKRVNVLLSKPSEIDNGYAWKTTDANAVLLIIALESWLIGQASDQGVQLTSAQCESASQLLVCHVAHSVKQQVSHLAAKQPAVVPKQAKVAKQPPVVPKQSAVVPKQPAVVPTQPAKVAKQSAAVPKKPAKVAKQSAVEAKQPAKMAQQSAVVANSSKNSSRSSEELLAALLIDFIQSRKPEWSKKTVKAAGPQLFERVVIQLDRLWKNPSAIGSRNYQIPINTDVEWQLCDLFKRMLQGGVIGVSQERIDREAWSLTGISRCLLGNLDILWRLDAQA